MSLLTARPTASQQTLTVSKTYSLEMDYVFQPRVFTELPTAQAVVLPFDGRTPKPAQYCYLKPRDLDVQTSYFDQVSTVTCKQHRWLPMLASSGGLDLRHIPACALPGMIKSWQLVSGCRCAR